MSSWLEYLRRHHIALLALFVALGGTSYAAATGSIDSREIKNNTVRGKDIRRGAVASSDVANRSLLARDFKPGQLPSGPAGPVGATGPSGPSALTARMEDDPITGPPTRFAAVSGPSPSSMTSGAVEQLTPNATIVARDLAVRLIPPNGNVGGSGYRVTLLDDGAPTALTCDAREPGNTCQSGAARAVVAGGSAIAYRVEPLAGSGNVMPAENRLMLGWRATAP